MLEIHVQVDHKAVMQALDDLGRQAAFAKALSLTRTAQDVKAAETQAIREVFDRPTPFSQQAVYMQGATPRRLFARVWLKDGARREHYLVPHIEGGGRPMKRFEERLRMTGYMRPDQRAVPSKYVQLDAYGNVSRGLIVKILSQLRTAVVSGDYSNATNSRRSQAKRATVQYFVSRGPDSRRHGFDGNRGRGLIYAQHLPAGIWERRRFAWGTAVRPVFLFVTRTSYRRRFDFFGIADQTIKARWPYHAARDIEHTLRTTRLK